MNQPTLFMVLGLALVVVSLGFFFYFTRRLKRWQEEPEWQTLLILVLAVIGFLFMYLAVQALFWP